MALANKETLVMAGRLMTAAARARGVSLLPVDSEHSAVFQCLVGHNRGDVHRVLLTASGGPFRELPKEKFAGVTVEDALRHPTWKMGAKITIDSATLMNKGLEVIEARWLFDLAPDPDRFPALRLARAALEAGGAAPVVLNAANEIAVAAFLERRIGFPEITQSIERALGAEPSRELGSIEECVEVDARARRRVREWIDARSGGRP